MSATTETAAVTYESSSYELEVLSPVANQDDRAFAPSPRLDTLSGKNIGLAWNRKPGGNVARERLANHLEKLFPDITLLRFDDDIPFGPETIEKIVEQCDGVIGTTADCGACSSWLAHDMIEIEKGGVPVVMIVAKAFIDDAGLSMQAYGMPDLPTAVFDGVEFTSQPDQAIFDLIDPIVNDIVDGLTKLKTSLQPSHRPAIAAEWAESEVFSAGDSLGAWRVFNEEFLDRGWGDGFPLMPPTREAVERMLTGTMLDPTHVVTLMEPGFGIATVEKIAICAAMAGCEPEVMPVLVAALKAMEDPKYWLRNVAVSTSPHAPMMVLNGPIVEKLGINTGRCALGPGKPSRVNTALGRALRLIMMNIGHAYPGTLDMDTIGSANKYSMCIGENEADSPWESLAMERGYQRSDSVITMFSVESQMEMYDLKNHTPETILNGYAHTVNSLGSTHSRQWMYPRRHADNSILLSPTHAKAIADHGWSRNDVRRYIYEKARVPAGAMQTMLDLDRIQAGMKWILELDPETPVPITGAYDWFHLVVIGGPVGKSSFTSGHGQCVSQKIDEQE